jgi:hypothetical protein
MAKQARRGAADVDVGVRTSAAAVLWVTAGATFMAFLDATVVNIAFPALRASFPTTSLASMSWVVRYRRPPQGVPGQHHRVHARVRTVRRRA